LIKMK